MEGLVKGQIKPVLTAMSIRPCRQRLLSEQYLSLWGEKRPLVLHLKVQSHCFGVMGGWQRASGFPFNPATAACTEFLSFSLFLFPPRILLRSLPHSLRDVISLTKPSSLGLPLHIRPPAWHSCAKPWKDPTQFPVWSTTVCVYCW